MYKRQALFSASLFRMYSMYAETKRWKTEILNANETELGGYKEISFMITGEEMCIRDRSTTMAPAFALENIFFC